MDDAELAKAWDDARLYGRGFLLLSNGVSRHIPAVEVLICEHHRPLAHEAQMAMDAG